MTALGSQLPFAAPSAKGCCAGQSGHLLNERIFNKKDGFLRVATHSVRLLVWRYGMPQTKSVSGEAERCTEDDAAFDNISDEPATVLGSAIMEPYRAGKATRNKAINDHVKRIE